MLEVAEAAAASNPDLAARRERGWTGTRYAAWLADTLAAALTRSARRR